MILFLGSWLAFALWTVITIESLHRLRNEQEAASHRDLWRLPRNRRALLLYAMWLAVMGYAVGSLTYIDVAFLDVARVFNFGVRLALLVIGLLLVWRD